MIGFGFCCVVVAMANKMTEKRVYRSMIYRLWDVFFFFAIFNRGGFPPQSRHVCVRDPCRVWDVVEGKAAKGGTYDSNSRRMIGALVLHIIG